MGFLNFEKFTSWLFLIGLFLIRNEYYHYDEDGEYGRIRRLLFGPKDSGGKCPSPTKLWNKQCCCGANCCWDHCEWSKPPANCLKGVRNSQWIFNNNLGYYQAFQNTGIFLTPVLYTVTL